MRDRMPTSAKVDQLIQNFAEQLQAAIRAQLSSEVTAAVQTALGGTMPKRGTVKMKVNGAVKAAKRSAGGKRTPEEIEKLASQLLAYIAKNPEQRSEQIAEATKLTTGELVLPIKRLLTEKKVKAKGKARGTTYTAAG
jgi:hypothetical protein